MRKRLAAVPFVLFFTVPSFGSTATIDLTCSYDQNFNVRKGITSPTTGRFSAKIRFSGEHVIRILVTRGDWCNPSNALATEMEISFACSLDLAGQRISYSFTFNRLDGDLEQRFFIAGKLGQIYYGQCSIAKSLF